MAIVPSTDSPPDPRVTTQRWVRPSTPEDGPAIVALMKEAGLEPHVKPEHLYWKYWRERADWPGSRSFVLAHGRDIIAHAAVVPGACVWGSTRGRVIHIIDWAARRSEIGVGVALMKHVGQLSDFLLGIGGSVHTLNIMPHIGYQARGIVTGYVRSLSALALLKRPCHPRWKRAPRFARSMLWSLMAPRAKRSDWQARRIGAAEVRDLASALPIERPGIVVFERREALFRHLLACPIVPFELYALEQKRQVRGYFLMSFAPGQARLADCWMASEDPADWRALVHLAVQRAKDKGNLAELVAWSSELRLSQTLAECGFHSRLTLPIYLRSSRRLAVPQEAVRVQMVENDACYLYSGCNELWA